MVYGAATKDLNGLEISEIGLMSEMGAVGFTNGNKSIKNSLVMRRLMSYAAMINRPIIQHAEDEDLSGLNQASTTSIRGEMNEGEISTRLGLIGIPACAEVIMIERDIRLAKLTGAHYHVAHVSTRDAVNVIREAKKSGLNITCDTAPPYFSLNESKLLTYNTAFKLSPPLRLEDDRLSLVQGIKDGLIDVIVSDHLPEDEESKRLPFAQAATGAIGVETLLPLSLEMYHNESLPLNKIVETLTINPAKILNIKKGTLAKGSDGDICIFDLEAPWKVNADKLKSKSKNTAIENRNLQGKILMTYLNGELVYSK